MNEQDMYKVKTKPTNIYPKKGSSMRTRTEVLIDEINQQQKLVFELRDKIEEYEQRICIAREAIQVAQANLREESKG